MLENVQISDASNIRIGFGAPNWSNVASRSSGPRRAGNGLSDSSCSAAVDGQETHEIHSLQTT